MIPSRRYLRVAFLSLAVSLGLFLVTAILEASTAGRHYQFAQTVERTASTVNDYKELLDTLPRYTGWLSYSLSVRDPKQPAWSPVKTVASIQSDSWGATFVRFLNQFGVLETRWSTVPLGVVEGQQYAFNYSYAVPGPLLPLLGVLCWLAFWVMLALWLYQDANTRLGKQSLPWLALGLIGGPVAIAIWLIQRPAPPPPPPVCPACKTEQVEDATYCVACGAHLKPTCGECGRAIELSWKHCPTCGNHLNQETA